MNKKLLISVGIVVLFIGLILLYQNRITKKTVIVPNPDALVTAQTSKAGKYLADSMGRTLYVMDGESNANIECMGDCLKEWPLFEYNNRELNTYTDDLAKQLNVVKREDRYYQYSYTHMPLYYYAGDITPGDRNGDGKNGTWHIVVLP